MGTYYAYANLDKKEYLEFCDDAAPGLFGQASPKNRTSRVYAEALAILIANCGWSRCRIALMADSEDLPWYDYVPGHEEWKNAWIVHKQAFQWTVEKQHFRYDTPEHNVHRELVVLDYRVPMDNSTTTINELFAVPFQGKEPVT